MPFKLRLKKSKQYNVASKNLYVVSVELLDNTIVECTLGAESTGQDCLNNVCQRLCLYQPEYFGLKYLSKKRCRNWIELERPLKKQLEKYGHETCMSKLFLGVQYYVGDVNLLQDEMTRYQYFLQLKTNIINGNLLCDSNQAVLLASYSLQAEFGDHDHERHTAEYLKDFVLLPKHMTTEERKLKALTEEVTHAHKALHGMAPTQAEVYYIMKCQQLDGYGRECHPAKDASGNELLVCPSLSGILLKRLNGKPNSYFKWNDILNLVHHKRTFLIECQKADMTLLLHLDDMDSAKYVWKMCVLQHRFYTKNISKHVESMKNLSSHLLKLPTEQGNITIEQNAHHNSSSNLQSSQDYDHSLEDLSGFSDEKHEEYANRQRTYSLRGHSSSGNTNNNSDFNGLNIQRQLAQNSKSIADLVNVSSLEIQQTTSSVSLPGLIPVNATMGGTEINKEQMKSSYLPAYRPAPDYETAIRHKYGNYDPYCISIPPQSVNYYNEADSLAELTSSGSSVQLQHGENHLHSRYQNFNDLSHLDYNSGQYPPLVGNGLSGGQYSRNSADRSGMLGPGHMMIPPVHTYSTPELTSQGMPVHVPQDQMLPDAHMMYQYKPPPPYPYNQRSSSSTPDLASQNFNNMVNNSSPDLVYRKLVDDVNRLTEMNPKAVPQVPKHSPPETPEHTSELNRISNDRIEYLYHQQARVANQPDVLLPVQPVSSLPDVSQAAVQRAQPGPQTPINSERKNSQESKSKTLPSGNSSKSLGPMMLAAMNGLTLSRPDLVMDKPDEPSTPVDPRRIALENKLAEGQVFAEFEQIPKKKMLADYKIASTSDNVARNRFRDVLPYDDNRVRLTPNKENKQGYINASHISVSVGKSQRFYIAAQGPLPNTVHSFWQMIWEQNVQLIVMLTEVQELGKEKCFLYWPHDSETLKLQFGEYQVTRKFGNQSHSFVTTSLTLYHMPSKQERSVWHIQYTDWPDHGCPDDISGFLSFMEEIDSVRRHAASERRPGRISKNTPVVIHCTAGVGRSGVTMLTDILLYSLDHNEELNVPKVLTNLRQQRMLIVQTLAQYKFIYQVLIQYLKNNRLI